MYKETVEGIGKEHDVIENVYWCMLIMCVWKACVWQSCLWKNCVWESCVWQSCVWQCDIVVSCKWHCCVCVALPCVKGLWDNFACKKIEGTPLLSLSATRATQMFPDGHQVPHLPHNSAVTAAWVPRLPLLSTHPIWFECAPRVLMKFISMLAVGLHDCTWTYIVDYSSFKTVNCRKMRKHWKIWKQRGQNTHADRGWWQWRPAVKIGRMFSAKILR